MANLVETSPLLRVAVGIIKREEKVLIAERPLHKPYSGYWEFPGGKIEADECGEVALNRELKEELGIEVSRALFWFAHHHAYPDRTVLLEIWLVHQFVGDPCSKENQQLYWASYAELQRFRLLEGNHFIVERLKTFLETNYIN